MILCTFPGRHGDLLWALPTLRALAEQFGPVDLLIAGEFAGLIPILAQQPYLGKVVADPAWGMSHGWQPPDRSDVISPYEKVLHLGYQRWPERVLPEEPYLQAVHQLGHAIERLDLQTPWLQRAEPWGPDFHRILSFGWTDCHFELKYGLSELLDLIEHDGPTSTAIVPAGSRWVTEGGLASTTWEEAHAILSNSELFLTDCSALHVLAVALGIPVVIVEPMEARLNPIFYPLGMDGPRVTVVRGLDGQPTFDARHTQETIEKVLHARH